MNDAWGYDDTEQTEPGHNDGPKALREAYKAQKAQNDAILAELAEIKRERAKEKVSSVFSELGVPDAVQHYTGEPDPEKARAWVQTMQATFGSGAQATPGSVPPAPVLDEQTQQQYQQMNEAGQSGAPLGNFEAAGSAVSQASNLDELIAAMARANHLNPGQ